MTIKFCWHSILPSNDTKNTFVFRMQTFSLHKIFIYPIKSVRKHCYIATCGRSYETIFFFDWHVRIRCLLIFEVLKLTFIYEEKKIVFLLHTTLHSHYSNPYPFLNWHQFQNEKTCNGKKWNLLTIITAAATKKYLCEWIWLGLGIEKHFHSRCPGQLYIDE